MEFLMTYGWAILVVLAAIGALAYFGFLRPPVPDTYSIGSGISTGEYKLTTGGALTLGIINSMGVTIDVLSFSVDTTGTSSDYACTVSNTTSTPLAAGAKAVFNFACGGTAPDEGDRFHGNVRIVYQKTGESTNHTITGEIKTKAEA